MQLKQLFDDEDAVSPVIGVILMVAITVILAAVIGTFVLGLGDSVNESGPTVNFQFSYDNMGDTGTMEITHNGGQDVEASNVVINVAGTSLDPTDSTVGFTNTWPTTVNTGDKLVYDESASGATDFASGDEVRIIWESPSGGSSSTIGQSQIP